MEYENEAVLLAALRSQSAVLLDLDDHDDDDDENGYHTPKNIFNPVLTRCAERASGSSWTIHRSEDSREEEHRYSTIKKSPLATNALPSFDEKNRTVCFSDASMEKMLEGLNSTKTKKKYIVISWLKEVETCDYILAMAIVIILVLFTLSVCFYL